MRHEAADPRVLIYATKPCPACIEQCDTDGNPALDLCNQKRVRAHAEFMRSLRQDHPREETRSSK